MKYRQIDMFPIYIFVQFFKKKKKTKEEKRCCSIKTNFQARVKTVTVIIYLKYLFKSHMFFTIYVKSINVYILVDMSKAKNEKKNEKKITQESKSILYFFIKTKSKKIKNKKIYCPTKSIDKNRNKKQQELTLKQKSQSILLRKCV